MSLWHTGPIEEYQVVDCRTGDVRRFNDFDRAAEYLQHRRADHPDHAINLIAVIDGG